ncbi:RNA 2'-phosphotransferase [Balneolaceae bacterium YR4-1]|uniref:Probable RNA 2'-phosphotransferase n=1 Tax=Halalkalibaculum roseum TaxID=2709311 RepID=A0A6M1SRC0_9BACT|nr:RNA 2'-phosphotransferase [Halalkalibaculum roseum]NGP77961.1 RNA 2'-phosphotransferase [Halalkalibaculum roseum]
MNKEHLTEISKFLSFVLRHHPESIELELDEHGWAHIDSLIEKSGQEGKSLTREKLQYVIDNGTKNRFTVSEDGKYIRAGYGHSIDVNLSLTPQEPPNTLYHGTARKNLESIKKQGIHSGSRNFVHLSEHEEDAQTIGQRHGRPVVLSVEAGRMHRSGYPFYRSESEPGIWLVEKVPPKFIPH